MASLASSLCQRVTIAFSCRSLKSKDLLSASDPFVVLEVSSSRAGPFMEVGRTEAVIDSNNPDFADHVDMDYMFEEQQYLRITVYDKDSDSAAISAHDRLGGIDTTLAALMGARGQVLVLPLDGDSSKGQLIVRGEKLEASSEVVRMRMSARKLDNKDGFFGKSDPFFTISRMREDGSLDKVWQSEVVMDNLSPTWAVFEAPVTRLCNGDYDRPLTIHVLDWDRDGTHDLIGCFQTSLRGMLTPGATFDVINAKKQAKKRKYKNSGTVTVVEATVMQKPQLLDYVRGGCEINLLVAIDYTASNGAPSLPSSLHYRNPMRPNEYQQAIAAIGDIVQAYDHDKRFPVFGFGGAVGGKTKHCFPLTGDPDCYEVDGVPGILEAYNGSLEWVSLSGPTLFAPIITQAVMFARTAVADASKYFVLLILTDGVINDMPATIDTIVEASELPLSIIIVGVGRADFSSMEALDGDGGLLRSSSGKVAKRDIVQFVPFRDYVAGDSSRLAKDTLKEVPEQLVAHYSRLKMPPGAPPAVDYASMGVAAPPSFEEAISGVKAGGGGGSGGGGGGGGAAEAPPGYHE
eukprot:PLAT3532.3.p1 GENE.PLAT3532.3~~PLAT3532.3.p1  ORF type:complete len:575 (-),score=322.82 PLAT3532.3:1822-3546(-)